MAVNNEMLSVSSKYLVSTHTHSHMSESKHTGERVADEEAENGS